MNPAEYDYLQQFYNVPSYKAGFLEGILPIVAAAALPIAGAAGLLGGAGAGAGALAETAIPIGGVVEGTAPLVSAGIGAPAATALPAAGGAAAAASGLAGMSNADWLRLGGAVAPGILGYLGADKVSDAYRDVSNQNLALGAPYRGLLQESFGPNFDLLSQPGYGDALDRVADISARGYSAKFGNPAGNPAAQAAILNDVWNQGYLPALSNYRGQLGQFGGLGLNTSGLAQLGGAANAGQGLDAIGVGLGRALNPQPTLQDLALIIGGMRT